MVKNRIYLIVVSILFVSLVSTIVFASVNINNVMGTSGVEIFLPSISSNYSSINVNNSQYLQGYTPTTLGNWLQTTFGWLTSLGNNIAFTNESNQFMEPQQINGESLTVNSTVPVASTLYLMTTEPTIGTLTGVAFEFSSGTDLEIQSAISHTPVVVIYNIPSISGSGRVLSIDALNRFVGLNVSVPTHTLNVVGDANITGLIYVNETSCGKLYTDANGIIICGTDASENISYTNLTWVNESNTFNLEQTFDGNLSSPFYFSQGQVGINKSIEVMENIDLILLTKTFCNVTYVGGIAINTTCDGSKSENLSILAQSCSGTDKVTGTLTNGTWICNSDVGAGAEEDPIFLGENVSLWNEAKDKSNITYQNLISMVYNHTTIANAYTNNVASGNNASWLSTYNSTYNALIPYGVNDTLVTVSLYNAQWNNTYNITYHNLIAQVYNYTIETFNLYNTMWNRTGIVNFGSTLFGNSSLIINTSHIDNEQVTNVKIANDTILWYKIADNTLNNKLQLNCENITGATSNLCTLVDTKGVTSLTGVMLLNNTQIINSSHILNENLTNYQIANNTINASNKILANSITDMQLNMNNLSRGSIGNCSTNTLIQNITVAGIQCVAPATGIASLSNVMFVNDSLIVNTTHIGTEQITNNKVANATLTYNKFVANTLNSMFTISWQNLSTKLTTWAFTNESNTFTLNNTFNGNITVLGGINISKYIYTNLSSCDTIDTTSTGMLVCGIDNAGTGASRTFVKLAENVTTTNSTHFNQTVLTLSAAARTNYTFACDLWQTSAAAATGVQYNVSSPIAPTYFSVSFQNPTSTTAYLIGACSGAARECTSLATASVLTAPMPTTIKGRLVNGANTNNLVIALRSEIALSAVQVLKESYCYMEIEA